MPLLKTFASLDALEDNRRITLCFRDKADAQRFKSFSESYFLESGCNQYGAYWVNADEKIRLRFRISPKMKTVLDSDLINHMAWKILANRLACRNHGQKPEVAIGQIDGALTFDYEAFPPRQVPAIGDMCRDLGWFDAQVKSPQDGRIIAIKDGTATIIAINGEDDYGHMKQDAEQFNIPLQRLMKICDYLTELRQMRGIKTDGIIFVGFKDIPEAQEWEFLREQGLGVITCYDLDQQNRNFLVTVPPGREDETIIKLATLSFVRLAERMPPRTATGQLAEQ